MARCDRLLFIPVTKHGFVCQNWADAGNISTVLAQFWHVYRDLSILWQKTNEILSMKISGVQKTI